MLILDGALGTALAEQGVDVSGPTWSARALLERRDALLALAEAYARAGADLLTTATYQATIDGFLGLGCTPAAAEAAFADATALVREAAERAGRTDVRVAASQGPFGAARADGSEFRGDYGVSRAVLRDDHRRRLELALRGEPDLVAFETIPSWDELLAIRDVLDAVPQVRAWISLSVAPDGLHLADGHPLADVGALFPEVFALGVNCCAPSTAARALGALGSAAAPRIVYPNRGEVWDASARAWSGPAERADFGAVGRALQHAGASIIGGCCRTNPRDIRALVKALRPPASPP